MRRGGPPAHSAATPEFMELPGPGELELKSQTSGHDCLECIEPLNTRPPRTSKFSPTGEVRTLRLAEISRR